MNLFKFITFFLEEKLFYIFYSPSKLRRCCFFLPSSSDVFFSFISFFFLFEAHFLEIALTGSHNAGPLCKETRPDTRLPKSRAGGQRPCLRSIDHLSRSSEVKEIKS